MRRPALTAATSVRFTPKQRAWPLAGVPQTSAVVIFVLAPLVAAGAAVAADASPLGGRMIAPAAASNKGRTTQGSSLWGPGAGAAGSGSPEPGPRREQSG